MKMTIKEIKEKNNELFQRYLNGDESLLGEIFELNEKLAYRVVNKHLSFEFQHLREDVYGVARIGLLKAIKTYKPSQAEFSTYAVKCIQNEMFMYYNKEKKALCIASLDKALDISETNEGKSASLLDMIGVEDSNIQKIEECDDVETIRQLCDKLPENYKRVIKRIYFSKENKNQTQIGIELGVSQSQVSRLEKRAIRMLRLAYDKYVLGKSDLEIDAMRDKQEACLAVQQDDSGRKVSRSANLEFKQRLSSDIKLCEFVKTMTPTILSPRESQVVESRFLTIPPKTIQAAAEELQISEAAVRASEYSGIMKLRIAFAEQSAT